MDELFARLRLARMALAGKIAIEEEDAEEVEATEESTESEFAGPLYQAQCIASPSDSLAVRAMKGGPFGPRVGVRLIEEGKDHFVVLAAPTARAIAAGILNSADEADGTSPMLFPTGGVSKDD